MSYARLLIFCGSMLTSFAVSAQRQAPALPEGEGKMLVETLCSTCHAPQYVGFFPGQASAAEWKALIWAMIALPDPQADTIAAYLARHFPRGQARQPTLVKGNVDIEIEEWLVPTLGQRPRDPIEAPDGSIWWAGMWASIAGRYDPKTGTFEEYKLPPASRPHTVIPDENGNIWYTGNSNATIGKLDPKTGVITEYATRAGDPHSAAFHPNGHLYFTAQRAAVLGRLNPKTGELIEIDTEPRPYGIQVAEDGTVWVAYNGTNKLGALNPGTMEVRHFDVPNERTRIRRLALDSQGMVWFVNSSLGKVGRLDPASGEIRQWDSPSGPDSHPYAIAVIDDVVWYNESGMRPDTLVRFDPATETFQSWAMPSGVGIVRNMWVTEAGHLLIHQTSSNRIGRVRIGRERSD